MYHQTRFPRTNNDGPAGVCDRCEPDSSVGHARYFSSVRVPEIFTAITANSTRRFVIVVLLASVFILGSPYAAADNRCSYDTAIIGGRVIDPSTKLDAIRNVGVQGSRIVVVTQAGICGRRNINASGLVVSPGFIDQHAHAQDLFATDLQARDGVTTSMELEAGVFPVNEWYADRRNARHINYGGAVSHLRARTSVLGPRGGRYAAATKDQRAQIAALIRQGLDEGALGVGFMANENPGAADVELMEMFSVASHYKSIVYYHPRTFDYAGVSEAISWANREGVSLQLVHITSSSLRDLPRTLELIQRARASGQDISVEMYPYTAASTNIGSPIFDPGWQGRLGGIDYGDLEWPMTHERLTEASFQRYRASLPAEHVIIHMLDEKLVALAMSFPGIMIASDSIPYTNTAGHPRSAGTFSRFLGRYVRDAHVMPLADGIARITYFPARRLEKVSAQMRWKGRLTVGADADVTIFDAGTIRDEATFDNPTAPSQGIRFVLVCGQVIVDNGALVGGVLPGRPVVSRYAGRRAFQSACHDATG
jgi:N-acyl-D-aspartate/D-glutamate deacylase